MPCCCETNIRAASVIGKVFLVLAQFVLFQGILHINGEQIFNGISNAILAGFLIFGAEKRNRTALLIWIILTSIGIIAIIILTLALIFVCLLQPSIPLSDIYPNMDWNGMTVKDLFEEDGMGLAVGFMILFLIGCIAFSIWTVIIAQEARKEIEQGEQLLPVFQQGETGHQGQATVAKTNMGPNVEPRHPGGIYKGQEPPPSYTTAVQENHLKV